MKKILFLLLISGFGLFTGCFQASDEYEQITVSYYPSFSNSVIYVEDTAVAQTITLELSGTPSRSSKVVIAIDNIVGIKPTRHLMSSPKSWS
ncbi:MAG: hypothetical protein HC842_03505 [Cytophagales bacterium]|nr:hypothetical protein [Cytophagales bacterium]